MNTLLTRVRPAALAGAALLALSLFAGCGGSSGSGTPRTGTIQVAMVDAPDPLIESAVITIDRVEAHVGSEWIPISTTPQTFNLLDLVSDERILGSKDLPSGHYTQIRLFPSAATVTDSEGTHAVFIPSGAQTGVKLNVDYDITPDTVTTILLDFNVKKSFVRQGNGGYHLQPVIPAVVKVLSGTVTGTVTASGTGVEGAAVTATYTDGPAYPIGTEVNSAVTLADGTFKVWALLPGTYTVAATFVDVSGATTTASRTDVVVQANENTPLGALPLQ